MPSSEPLHVLQLPANMASLVDHNSEALHAVGVDSQGALTIVHKGATLHKTTNARFFTPPERWYSQYPYAAPVPKLPENATTQERLKYFPHRVYKSARRAIRLTLQLPQRIPIFFKRIIPVHRDRKCVRFAKKFNFLHWHSYYFFGDLTFDLLRNREVAGVVTWHGADIRIPEFEFQSNPYFRMACEVEPLPERWGTYKDSKRAQDYFHKELHLRPVISRGMAQYILPEYRKDIRLVFHPLPLTAQPQYPNPNNRRPVLVHAPSDKNGKGTAYIDQAIERLRGLLDFEYIELSGVKWEEAQKVIASCDIFIDQIILGDHGMASLEAMGYGKPVVCYIKESIKELLPEDAPFFNACPDNITSRLYALISDGELRLELGRRSREYVEKYHDPVRAGHRLEEIYREAFEENSRKRTENN